MNLLAIEQHSYLWYQARLGCATGSRIKDALSRLTRASNGRVAGDPTQGSLDYAMELAIERITGIVPDHYVTPSMDWGIANEAHAVRAYEAITEKPAHKVGIAAHGEIERFMASPDRYIGTAGVLEVKCPTSFVHMSYIKGGIVPLEYQPQCLAELACDESREWLDFVSFDPRFTGPAIKLQTFIAPRMYRDKWKTQIAALEDGVRKFLTEVDTLTAQLQEMGEKRKFHENL